MQMFPSTFAFVLKSLCPLFYRPAVPPRCLFVFFPVACPLSVHPSISFSITAAPVLRVVLVAPPPSRLGVKAALQPGQVGTAVLISA